MYFTANTIDFNDLKALEKLFLLNLMTITAIIFAITVSKSIIITKFNTVVR